MFGLIFRTSATRKVVINMMLRNKVLLVLTLTLNTIFIYLVYLSPELSHINGARDAPSSASRGKVHYSSGAGDGINATTLPSIESYRGAIARARQILVNHNWMEYDSRLNNLNKQVSQSIWKQAQRIQKLKDRCHEHRLEKPGNSFDAIAFPPKLPVGFCITPKTGVSSWVQHLLMWSGLQYPDELVHLASYDRFLWFKSVKIAQHYVADHGPLMVLPIRHPYDRLVSLYWNKFADEKDPFLADFRERCRNNIQARRKPLAGDATQGGLWYKKPEMEESKIIHFSDLVQCLLEVSSHCGGNVQCLSLIEPHLRPMHLVCPPCDVNYDVIVKFDSFKDDVELVRLILLSQKLATLPHSEQGDPTSPHETNPGAKEAPGQPPSSSERCQTAREDAVGLKALSNNRVLHLNSSKRRGGRREVAMLLRQLSEDELRQLRELYKYDFLLYDYDPEEYKEELV